MICARISINIITAFTDFAVCQFTQLERWLWFQKIALWSLVSKVCGFRGASTPLSRKMKDELQQKCRLNGVKMNQSL